MCTYYSRSVFLIHESLSQYNITNQREGDKQLNMEIFSDHCTFLSLNPTPMIKYKNMLPKSAQNEENHTRAVGLE